MTGRREQLARRVNPRARTREDRAGDPLDGLVNLFDLGIVLSVAFLLAALSSLDLTSALFTEERQAPPGSVTVKPGEESRPIELQPGERVVGRGEPVGTVYELDDGRTIIVQPEDAAPAPGAGGVDSGAGNGATGGGATGGTAVDDGIATDGGGAAADDEPTLGDP
ncbi:MAG: DUF2149 domain-containing protein [Thermoleophilaceae bacterium]